MNPRITKKERTLIKGALRRVFSRSDLRKAALATSVVDYIDLSRPRVKKWSLCPTCNKFEPTYKMQVDHVIPVIPVDRSLEDMNIEEVVDRMWCVINNLKAICFTCHNEKTMLEAAERRRIKKEKKLNETKRVA